MVVFSVLVHGVVDDAKEEEIILAASPTFTFGR